MTREICLTIGGRPVTVPIRRDRRARRITIHIDASIGGAKIVMPIYAALAEAKDHLRSAAAAFRPGNFPAGTGRAYRKVVRKLTADAGTFGARCWACWQRLFPWVR